VRLAGLRLVSLAAGALFVTFHSFGADSASPLVVLEARSPAPGAELAGYPTRFLLLEDGQVFVGGTSQVWTTRLEKDEVKAVEERLDLVRKMPGLAASVSLGPGASAWRLRIRKMKPAEIEVKGDPKAAPFALRTLAALVTDLDGYSHPALRPLEPASYLMTTREGSLPGGCRPWTLPITPDAALAGPRVVAAAVTPTWPTGASPASVCSGDKTYVVTFRPLLPGEKP
jgi:hypothetical protein